MLEIVDEISGAVHRVQDPHPAVHVHAAVILLLPQELGARVYPGELPENELLHPHIHLRHIVGVPFFFYMVRPPAAGQLSSRCQHDLQGLSVEFHLSSLRFLPHTACRSYTAQGSSTSTDT